MDEAWLKLCNGERALAGLSHISDEQFERVIEELEVSNPLTRHDSTSNHDCSIYRFDVGTKYKP